MNLSANQLIELVKEDLPLAPIVPPNLIQPTALLAWGLRPVRIYKIKIFKEN